MRFSMLGQLLVVDSAGSRVTLDGPKLRVLLATLLLHANALVSAEELAEMVWDGSPPPGAVVTLRSHVRRLRRALGTDATRIAARDPGYLISVVDSELDILEFEALCRDARLALRAAEWANASVAATRALRLWRAAPLMDVPAEALRGEFVPHFEQLRLQVLEDRFDAGIRLGHYQELIPQLLDATARHPLRERFHAQLMLALASTGQRAQALHAYQEARRGLIHELGIEPGPELREIHRQVLAGDVARTGEKADDAQPGEAPGPAVTGPPPGPDDAPADVRLRVQAEPATPALPQPAQLPADIADFTGREARVSQLYDALASQDAASGFGTMPVVVIAGAAGLGKTTLAVHVATTVRDLFPDGQLYADLRGASANPAALGEVLARFLRDLGTDGGKVPVADEERAALYRTQLAGRRMLIVLDDAKDLAQVRPLLPGTASCAVLVTTRNTTLYLVSTRLVDLDTLPEPEALELFSRIVGHERTAAEPGATAEVLTACAGLPLAIRICGARLATRRHWQIATMAGRLRDERHRLDELQVGDLEVRASFRVSYDSLLPGRRTVDPARAFRLLGCWQGKTITLPAAAALIGEPEGDVTAALETLVNANLLESPEPDCYQLHDLLRLFAAEQARAEEPADARLDAEARLLRWYTEISMAAADILSPHRYRIPAEEPRAPSPLLNSAEDVLAWYDSEQVNLITAIRQAAAAGLHELAWRLPTALYPLFNRRHNWPDCITAHRIGAHSARAAGHRHAEAWTLQNLGNALGRLGDTEALACLEEALAIRRESGDHRGECQTENSLANIYFRLQGPEAAIGHSLRSLELHRQLDNPALLGIALTNHVEYCRELGRLDEAAECLQEALGIQKEMSLYTRGHMLLNLGRVHLQSGQLAEAIASLAEGCRLLAASGDLIGQARGLRYLGAAQRGVGQEDQARESMAAALALFGRLGADVNLENYALGVDDSGALSTLPGPVPYRSNTHSGH